MWIQQEMPAPITDCVSGMKPFGWSGATLKFLWPPAHVSPYSVQQSDSSRYIPAIKEHLNFHTQTSCMQMTWSKHSLTQHRSFFHFLQARMLSKSTWPPVFREPSFLSWMGLQTRHTAFHTCSPASQHSQLLWMHLASLLRQQWLYMTGSLHSTALLVFGGLSRCLATKGGCVTLSREAHKHNVIHTLMWPWQVCHWDETINLVFDRGRNIRRGSVDTSSDTVVLNDKTAHSIWKPSRTTTDNSYQHNIMKQKIQDAPKVHSQLCLMDIYWSQPCSLSLPGRWQTDRAGASRPHRAQSVSSCIASLRFKCACAETDGNVPAILIEYSYFKLKSIIRAQISFTQCALNWQIVRYSVELVMMSICFCKVKTGGKMFC